MSTPLMRMTTVAELKALEKPSTPRFPSLTTTLG